MRIIVPQICHSHFGLGHQASDKSSTTGPSGVCRAKNSSESLWHIDLAKFQGEAFFKQTPTACCLQTVCQTHTPVDHTVLPQFHAISINHLLLQKFGPDCAAEEEKQGQERRTNDGKRYVKNCLTSIARPVWDTKVQLFHQSALLQIPEV